MRKLVLGLSAAALVASAAMAQETATDNSRLAASSAAATFTKLDSDADGRISAIEAANDSKVAAGFTQADADKDGYLSKAEFAALGKGGSTSEGSSAQPRSQSSSGDTEPAPRPRQ